MLKSLRKVRNGFIDFGGGRGIPVLFASICPNTATARAEDEKVRAAAAKAVARAKRVAARAARRQQQAVNLAVYAALVAVVPVVVTPGIDRNSLWANVADLCASCGLPPGRCMCI